MKPFNSAISTMERSNDMNGAKIDYFYLVDPKIDASYVSSDFKVFLVKILRVFFRPLRDLRGLPI